MKKSKIKIDWNKFIRDYCENESHWYVSKIKVYTEESYENLRTGLLLLDLCFIDENSEERKELESFVYDPQLSLPGIDKRKLISRQWNFQTQLFYTSRLDSEELISELNRARHDLRKLYTKIRRDVESNLNFHELLKKYNAKILNDYAANARNFVSFYKKLGFAWIKNDKGISISDAGYKFIESSNIQDLLEIQRIKWQLWNPTVRRSRYGNMKILPYIFLLRLLIKLKDEGYLPILTKREYALFVTKATNMDELENVFNHIIAFRSLDDSAKNKIIKKLNSIKRVTKGGKNDKRSLFEEMLDSAGKEIGFFTFDSLCKAEQIGRAFGIVLGNEKKARTLIKSFQKDINYIDVNNEEEWFQYYGDTSVKPVLADVMKYYSESGKYEMVQKTVNTMIEQDIGLSEEIKKRREEVIYEKEIEDFYEKNISIIEKNIKLLRNGRQYPTEIGNIDLLAKDKSGKYVVIELKRNQADDDTIGQLLRYMGWVHINLSGEKPVLGIVLSQDITNKLKYARLGIQHPSLDEILKLKKHPAQVIELIKLIKKKIEAEEFDYPIKEIEKNL